MLNNDTNEQIPLFELPEVKIEKTPVPARNPPATAKEKETPVKKKVVEREGKSASTAGVVSGMRKTGPGKARGVMKSPLSGQVPEGDVRLTANIREDLHLKLKI